MILIHIYINSNLIAKTIVLMISVFQIQPSDKLSKYLCKHCLELLDNCIKFRELCRKNNEYLITINTDAPSTNIGIIIYCNKLFNQFNIINL